MKKIFTTILVLSAAWSMQAGLHLSYEKLVGEDTELVNITKDTTIIVTEYEYDEDLEEAIMELKGQLYSDESQAITVTIQRPETGIKDQFCPAGSCIPGNGELTQVCEFTVGTAAFQRSWSIHYTPQVAGNKTISYLFNDGVNPVLKMTVVYSYNTSAVEDVHTTMPQGAVYNLLGQRMPNQSLSELPKGIYIINGKKYIKK